MHFRKLLTAVTAALTIVAASATPSHAAYFYWTYHAHQSVEICMRKAASVAQQTGMTQVRSGATHVEGEHSRHVWVTLLCLPSPTGATGLITIAADDVPQIRENDLLNLRDDLSYLFQR